MRIKRIYLLKTMQKATVKKYIKLHREGVIENLKYK